MFVGTFTDIASQWFSEI